MNHRYLGYFKLETGGLMFGWLFGLINVTFATFCFTLCVFTIVDSRLETSFLDDGLSYITDEEITFNIRFLIFFAAVSAFFAYLSFRMINGIREQNHHKLVGMFKLCISITMFCLVLLCYTALDMTCSGIIITAAICELLFGYQIYVIFSLYHQFEKASLAGINDQVNVIIESVRLV